MDPAERLIGQTVAERYRLDALLGIGGMGAVFRATELERGLPVAIKVIRPGREASKARRPRFLREARLMAGLRHPNIVRVVDFGRWSGGYFMAMELVEGLSLYRLLGRPWSLESASRLLTDVLSALAHVHARGVIHRDIKPENILVSRREDGSLSAKLTDFGIAFASVEADPAQSQRITIDGVMPGTPAYMAPEVVTSQALVGPPADIYSVGVMLYELVVGKLPFDGPAPAILVSKVVEDAPRPKTDRHGHPLPRRFADVLTRMLTRAPEERFPLAADAVMALAPWAGEARMGELEWRAGLAQAGRQPVPRAQAEAVEARGTQALTRGRAELMAWGRDALLAAIDEQAAHVRGGEGRVVLLVGEPGMGKTELLDRGASRLAETGRFLVLRANYQEPAGIRGALERHLGTAGLTVSQLRRSLAAVLERFDDDDPREVDDLVAYLRPRQAAGSPRGDSATPGSPNAATGPRASDTGAGIHQRERALILRLLRRIASTQPVLLAVDNLDRGGAEAAAFLEYVLFEASYEPFPLMVLAATRPAAVDPRFAPTLERSRRFEGRSRLELTLEPLSAQALAEGLEAAYGLETHHSARIAQRADGNPLFAALIAESGGTGSYSHTTPGGGASEPELPRAVRQILEQSLRRRLAGQPRGPVLTELLQFIAIVGEYAPIELLEAVLEAAGEGRSAQTLDDDLDALIDLGLLRDVGQTGQDAVVFSQGLMREAILLGMPASRMQELSAMAARAREAWVEAMTGAQAGAIGDHWSRAGAGDEACAWWLEALRLEQEALVGARWGQRALTTMRPDDPRRPETAVRVARMLFEAADLDGAEQVIRPFVEAADDEVALLAGEVLGDILENRAAGVEWSELIETMTERGQAISGPGRRAMHRARALFFNTQGRGEISIYEAEQALVGAIEPEDVARGLMRLSFAHGMVGEHEEALVVAERAVDVAEGRSDLLVRACRTLGNVHRLHGRGDDAVRWHRRSLELARRSGRTGRVAVAQLDIGQAHQLVGRYDEARPHLEKAIAAAHDLGLAQTSLFAKIRWVLGELMTRRTEGLGEVIDELAEAARRARFFLFAAAEGPFRAWLALLEGRADDAFRLLPHFSSVEGLPPIAVVAEVSAGLAEPLVELAEAGDSRALDPARGFLATAFRYWKTVDSRAHLEAVAKLRARVP